MDSQSLDRILKTVDQNFIYGMFRLGLLACGDFRQINKKSFQTPTDSTFDTGLLDPVWIGHGGKGVTLDDLLFQWLQAVGPLGIKPDQFTEIGGGKIGRPASCGL